MHRAEFEHVSKCYRLGTHGLTAREALVRATRRALNGRKEQRFEQWSLRDVSFTVSDGEALGIVGRNGAGKSTILKILTQITSPTSGICRTRGRVAALLEVGTGFHPELTGRENIQLNAAVLGMTRRDIDTRFDSIVDFAGVQKFLNTPVKRYSSGMYLRLAFAVAAHVEPDVLVVDEILAVGDAEFQRKCVQRMTEAEAEGRTIVFVSHDLDTLTRLCARSIWLDAGRVQAIGPTGDVIREYLRSGQRGPARDEQAGRLTGPVKLISVRILSAVGGNDVLLRRDPLHIEIRFEVTQETPGLDLAVFVTTSKGVRVLDEVLSDYSQVRLAEGRYLAQMDIPPILNVGEFAVGVWFGTAYGDLLEEPTATLFELHGSDRGRRDRVVVLHAPINVSAICGTDC
jgi:ABC-type polysaccharide/polyol phosphate transport system ATPase subunit